MSILLPEHLRNFKQLLVGLFTCSGILRRGRDSGKTAKRVRKRQRQRARQRLRRYYASSADASAEDTYETSDDSSDDDASYGGRGGGGRVGCRNGGSDNDSVKTSRSFADGSVLGSVAPGRAAPARGVLSGSPARGTSAGLSIAGGSWGDLSCVTSGVVPDASATGALPSSALGAGAAAVKSAAPPPSAAAAHASPGADEENADAMVTRASSRSGGSWSRKLSLSVEAKTIATLLTPTSASFAIWIIDLFVVGALIAAAIIDAQRAEIALHKVPS